MQVSLKFHGKNLVFNLQKADFAEMLGDSNLTDSLVQYNSATTTITVDERASDFYAIYAAIHECICCGNYGHLAPKCSDPNKLCAEIDKMLVSSMQEAEKKAYISKRIEMFATLLRLNLNQKLNASFRNSLSELKKLNKNL